MEESGLGPPAPMQPGPAQLLTGAGGRHSYGPGRLQLPRCAAPVCIEGGPEGRLVLPGEGEEGVVTP